jgi:hypothetical protein
MQVPDSFSGMKCRLLNSFHPSGKHRICNHGAEFHGQEKLEKKV